MPVSDLERGCNALQVRLEQLSSEVPRGGLGTPGHARALIGTENHAVALLTHVDLGFEVDRMRQLVAALAIECHNLRHVISDEIHVLHRENGQLYPDHAPDLTCPQA